MAQNASDSQKVDFLWKKIVYGAAKTDISGNIDATNEPNPSPLQIRGDKILQNSNLIANVIPASNSSVVTVYPTAFPVECTSTAAIPTPTLTWQTGQTFWVPPEFGSTYQIKVYIAPSGNAANVASKGTQVFATGSGNNDLWVFDYQAGILNFNSNNTPYNASNQPISFTGNSVYISGAVYSGAFGLGNLSYIGANITSSTDITISTTNNANIILNAGGTGIVQIIGDDAVGIPYGNTATRPANPNVGYIRINTDLDVLEYWNGSSWIYDAPFEITSQSITPNGSSNAYVLTSNTSTAGVMVNINGTIQQPYTAYNIVGNNSIVFTEIPLTTDIIEVRTIATGVVAIQNLAFGDAAVSLDEANVNITGNILPSANVTYSLGSNTLQWKDLWISGNSIYIGGSALTVANGQLSIGGNIVGSAVTYSNVNVKAYTETMGFKNYSNVNVAAYATTQSYTNYSNVNVAAYLGSENVTIGGNITVAGAQKRIIGDFGNALRSQRLLFQSNSAGNTSLGIISNGGAYSEVMVYSDEDCQLGAGAIQAFDDEVRIKTYNYGGPNELPMRLFVGNEPIITLGSDYTTTLSNNLIVSGTITTGTWNGGTIGVAYGGTGATTATGALTNLLPSGAATGYVLTTGGAGSYYWATSGGGGGATVGQTINTLRQSNTATQGQTVFALTGNITYTPGSGQLGVYINGVRQFPTEYTETSSNVFTLGTGINAGDVVFAEINRSQSFNNYANLTYASNVGNISASGLTVQSAIESLENNKSPLSNPVFSGVTTIGGNLVVQGNLFVNGNLTTINANNLVISDSMIYLADDNPTDTLDIGIVSAFTSAVRYQHTGFVRDATDGDWKLFANVVAEPTTTIDFTNASYSNLQVGNLRTIGTVNASGNVLASTGAFGTVTTSGNVTVSGNVVFSGWSIRETGTKLYFAYNGVNKMSLDTGGNLVVTGDLTAFGTIT
jgi:hypothetical protein